MKLKITSILMLAVVASFSFLAFAPKADVYTVDVTKSTITWEGKKFSGGHNGTVALTSGTLAFNGQKLVEGGFIANMTTIKDADGSAGLEKHLKADDFFGVEKFPAANFVIKKVEGAGADVKVTGDLTIKGKTNSISFPAKITWNADKTVTATADKIVIDRTKFGIEYKSKSIFSSIGDNFIYDEFTLAVKLVAKK
ncbi:YceI family protein [Pedobacter sp. ASV28]|jgi:polyisoprenoid-binding protein YceI|uniref:YceI family protein n=1 Tax=Pedobacter sp. ASV28 TaxID=2795123 RepID=UPI0018EADAD0|nr:YceI family protein [Pedobacter sp. ASV28]